MITKKGLQEMKVIIYANRVHLSFWWLNEIPWISVFYSEQIYVKWPLRKFLGMYVSENKANGKDSCWSMWIVFTLIKWELVTWPCCIGCRETPRPSSVEFEFKFWTWVFTRSILYEHDLDSSCIFSLFKRHR